MIICFLDTLLFKTKNGHHGGFEQGRKLKMRLENRKFERKGRKGRRDNNNKIVRIEKIGSKPQMG